MKLKWLKLDFVPDFVLTKGNKFVYDVNATDVDDDVLRFYTNNSLIIMNESDGILSFTPMNIGLYETKVCVEDKYKTVDCGNIKFM